MPDASKYGYYKYCEDIDTFVDLTDTAAVVTSSAGVLNNYADDDVNIPTVLDEQIMKIDRERKKRYKHFGRKVGDYNVGVGKVCLIDSDILSKKVDYWPHLLSSRGITIRVDLRADSFHTVSRNAIGTEDYKDGQATSGTIEDVRVKFTNLRLTTLEIVPSIEFQKALLDLQMSKGYFVYPTYSVQGQQVDITSANIQLPIDAAGSRVEYTDVCFIDETGAPYGRATLATRADLKAYFKASNELVLANTLANAGSVIEKGGSKTIRFLPKINKMSVEIAGQEYPGCSTLDAAGDNPQRMYELYRQQFKDEELIPYTDWIF